MRFKPLLLVLALIIVAVPALALSIKDIVINPQEVEVGSPVEFLVLVTSDLRITSVEGFVNMPNAKQEAIRFEKIDEVTYRLIFENTMELGGYGLDVVASDEKESTKAFAKFGVYPVPEPPTPLPVNTTMDIVKNDTNKIISILNISQNQMSEISANLSKIAKSTSKPVMYMHGTEYTSGQDAKLWLQLLNSSGDAVNTGICFVDIYTPDNLQYIERATMTNMNHDGIYYYDLIAPSIDGVYPAIAECYFDVLQVKYYATSFTQQNYTSANFTIATDNLECNGFSCGTGWNAGWQNTSARTTITTTGSPSGTYQIQGDNNFDIHRYVDASQYGSLVVSFRLGAGSLEAGDICHVEYATNGIGGTFTDLVTITNGQDDIGSTTYTYDVTAYGITANSGIGFYATTNENGDYCYLDNITFTGVLATPDINAMRVLDTNSTMFQEFAVSGKSRLDVNLSLNETGNCTLIPPALMTGITIFANAQFSSVIGDDITLSIWNYTSGTWHTLPNTIPQGASFSSVSNSIQLTNLTTSGYYNSTTGIRIRINDSNLTDNSNSILYIDQFYVGCDQFANPAWQEVRGSSEMHISPPTLQTQNPYIQVETCDGYLNGKCAVPTDDAEFPYTEGEFEDLVNFTAILSRNDTSIFYYTPYSVDCSAMYWIKMWNGSSWENFTDYTTYSNTADGNCEININVDLVYAQQYQLWLKYDNYMKWEVELSKHIIDTYTEEINTLCADRNFTYDVPILDTTALSNDTFTDYCHRALDDVWWSDNYYNLSLGATNAGEYSPYLAEMRVYREEIYRRVIYLRGALSPTNNLLNQILAYLTDTIYPYLQQMWNKLLGIETQLNTTISITNQSLILNTEINQTTHLVKNDTSSIISLINNLNVSSGSNLNALNASMMAGFAEKDAHIQDSYNNLTNQAASAYANTTSNFNLTWNLLNLMEQNQNATNNQILNWLLQIDTNINSSKTLITQVNTSLTTNMNLINSSLSAEIGAINTSILNSIDVLNATTAANFDDVRALINALTLQVGQNHNITQANITQLKDLCAQLNISITQDFNNLNSSLQIVRTDILAEINTSIETMLLINNTLSGKLDLINASLYTEISSMRSQIQANFTDVFSAFTALSGDLNGTKSELKSDIYNLSLQLNETKWQLHGHLDALNQSIQEDYALLKNDTTTIIGMIGNFSATFDGNFTQVLNAIGSLSTQVDLNHNITQSNLSDIRTDISLLNQSVTTNFNTLNATIAAAEQNVLNKINDTITLIGQVNQSTQDTLNLLNQSMTDQFTALNNNLLLINQSLDGAIQIFKSEVQSNFTQVFSSLADLKSDLNSTKTELKSDINDLSLKLEATNQSIQLKLDALNISMWAGFAEKDAHIQDAYNNITSQINNLSITWDGNFSQVLQRLDVMSIQIDSNQNITQQNISALNTYLLNLNTSIQQGFTDIGDSITLLNQTMINEFIYTNSLITAMNQSVTQQITDLRSDMNSNFSATFSLLGALSLDLNTTKQEIRGDISNLSLQLNETKYQIEGKLDAMNITLTQDLAAIKNDTDNIILLLNDLNISIGNVMLNISDVTSLINSAYANLSQQMSENTSIVLSQLAAVNSSLAAGISEVKNDTVTIISQIAQMDVKLDSQYSNTTSFINALSVQIDTNHNITQQNISQLWGRLDALNDSSTSNFLALNTSIAELKSDAQTYYNNLNASIELVNQLVLSVNSSLSAEHQNLLAFLQSINSSLTGMLNSLSLQMDTGFNASFAWFTHADARQNITDEKLLNLSLQLNETKWQLHAHLDAINLSLWTKMDGVETKTDYAISLIENLTAIATNNSEIMNYLSSMNTSIANEFVDVDSQFNYTWGLINNVSQQVNFTPVLNAVEALSVQEDNHFNITQQNITQVFNKLDALNDSATTNFNALNQSIATFENKIDNYVVWLNGTLIEMKSEISNIENMTLIINQSVVRIENDTGYIIDLLTSWENLTLSVEAPAMCLYGTNWIVKAQVTDKFHVIMSPLDGIYCNVTTDLWGTATMTYSYLDQKWKYIHPCDPNLVTFGWNVECDYI